MSGNSKFQILLIDDDQLIADSLSLCLPEDWELEHDQALNPEHLKSFYNVAFVDMHLTQSGQPEGVEVIKKLHQAHPHLEIVAISGELNRQTMEACLVAGAGRFLAKPLSPDEIQCVLEKIEALWTLRDSQPSPSQSWIGKSKSSQQIQKRIADLMGEAGPILIEGESGTGKEVVAQLLRGPTKAKKPFVSVNVAAIPEELFESELFGYVKGAFTGADKAKFGIVESADGGNLFLDEIEALPLHLQPKLLRFLESGEVRRVGATESFNVSARVICATNQKLEALVAEDKFREDLLWRLNGKKVSLPPLRQRLDDIDELANYFLEQQRPRANKTLSDEALERLKEHHWPGNVRELKRVCEQLATQSPLPVIRTEDVDNCLGLVKNTSKSSEEPQRPSLDLSQGLTGLVKDTEKQAILQCLKTPMDIEEVAKVLQISRSSLYKKMKDYEIETKRN